MNTVLQRKEGIIISRKEEGPFPVGPLKVFLLLCLSFEEVVQFNVSVVAQ